MTKAELRSDLAGKTFVESLIGDESYIGEPHSGISEYEQSILEVSGNAAVGHSIRYYVRDEGLETETAWYKGSEPVAKIGA